MTSVYTLRGANHYRFVGKTLYRLPYMDAANRRQMLKVISKVKSGNSPGYWLVVDGKRQFWSLARCKANLVKERLVITDRVKGMPF